MDEYKNKSKKHNPSPGTEGPPKKAKKLVLKALNDQLKVRAQKLQTETCISRKFARLWMRKTFGRVVPRSADDFYRRRLIRRVFDQWRDDWWTEKMDWRLNIRAQCHDRYRLCRHSWNCWKQFVIMKRIRAAKMALATTHGDTALLTRAVASWRQYVDGRRAQRTLDTYARSFADRRLVQTYWSYWHEQRHLQTIYRDLDQVAMQFWSSERLTSSWLLWKRAHRQRVIERQKEALALEHHQLVVRVRMLSELKRYALWRKQKRKIKGDVDRFHAGKLVRRYFSAWCRRRHTLSLIRQRESEIDQSGSRFKVRRAFVNWQHYVELRRLKFEKEVLADEHYRAVLQTIVISGLRLAVAVSRVQEARKRLAFETNCNNVLRRAWTIWVSRCDKNEEIRTIPQRRNAERHHSTVVLKKMLRHWVAYIHWRRLRQGEYIRADALYTVRILPKYLTALKQHAGISARKREMRSVADECYSGNTTAKFYYLWYHQYEQSLERRAMMRMAILHHQDTMIAGYFLTWKLRRDNVVAKRQYDVMAARHYVTSLCGRVVDGWREFVTTEKDRRQNCRVAYQHRYGKVLGRAWSSWKQAHLKKQNDERQHNLSVRHRGNHLLRVAMDAWLQYHLQWQRIMSVVTARVTQRNKETLALALIEWRNRAVEKKLSRAKKLKAQALFNVTLVNKVFAPWREFAAMRAYKRSRSEAEAEAARRQLNQHTLRSYLHRWMARRDEELITRLKYQQAVIHANHRALTVVFKRWHLFVRMKQRKTLLGRQATWFNNTRLIVTSFVSWSDQHKRKREEIAHTASALWHWSLVLQAKVFDAWIAYKTERKRKKLRWSSAMERRVVNLQTEGLRRWLSTANQLQMMRERWSANQEAVTAYRTHHLVRRCASHWRLWVRRRSQERPWRKRQLLGVASHQADEQQAKKYSPMKTVVPRRGPIVSQSSSPLVTQRPKPRLPDFLLASVEASMRSRIDTKKVNVSRLDAGDACTVQTGDVIRTVQTSDVIRAVQTSDVIRTVQATTQQQPVIHMDQGEITYPRRGVDFINLGNILKEQNPSISSDDEELEAISDIQINGAVIGRIFNGSMVSNGSPDKRVLLFDGRLQNVSPLKAVGEEKLELMTPDMFMVPASVRALDSGTGVHSTRRIRTNVRDVAATQTSDVLLPPLDFSRPETDVTIVTQEEELTIIRNKLQSFRNRKSELSLLKKQAAELEQWLMEEKCPQIQRDLDMLHNEMLMLSANIEQKRPENEKLVARARFLMATLTKN